MSIPAPNVRTTGGKGPAVDAGGGPVNDPTENVKSLVLEGLKRQDDLREMASRHIIQVMDLRSNHSKDVGELRAAYEEKLRIAESARIDAIRKVDVEAVARAAQVSSDQAGTLAAQVSASAETLRTQVATVAAAAATSMAQALLPITKSIEDLRAAQYQAQGQKSQRTEGKDNNQWLITVVIAIASVAATWIATHK